MSYIHKYIWEVTTQPFSNFNGDLAKTSSKGMDE